MPLGIVFIHSLIPKSRELPPTWLWHFLVYGWERIKRHKRSIISLILHQTNKLPRKSSIVNHKIRVERNKYRFKAQNSQPKSQLMPTSSSWSKWVHSLCHTMAAVVLGLLLQKNSILHSRFGCSSTHLLKAIPWMGDAKHRNRHSTHPVCYHG
jgi:hypothetical protein